MKLRELTDSSDYTCDWGGCNAIAVAERADGGRWLSVCPRHGGLIERRSSPGRGSCRSCGRSYALTVDGKLPLHGAEFGQRCPGSRDLPGQPGQETP